MRILIIDGSEVFRLGMRAAVAAAPELEIIADAGTARAGEAAARAQQPEVVIADLDLFERDAFLLASELRAAAPGARILVLSSGEREAIGRQAVLAGASGCVSKLQTAAEILTAIREVAAGREPPISSLLADSGAARGEPRPAAALSRLSSREREIFDLIIWGQTNKQVAARLGISVKTVETHRSHINGKLQVHSAAELVRLASLCGVLSQGPAPAPMVTPTQGPRLVAKIG